METEEINYIKDQIAWVDREFERNSNLEWSKQYKICSVWYVDMCEKRSRLLKRLNELGACL